MSLKKTVEEKAREVGKALMDKKNQAKVKAEIGKRLAQGREQLVKLEAKLKDPKTRAALKKSAAEAARKVKALRVRFQREERKAENYTRKNPRKALLIAAAAGALAGALWISLKRRKG